MADAAPAPPAQPQVQTQAQTPLKKGSLVRVDKAAYFGSLEASASDALPGYLAEGPGEILAIKGDYAQLRWRRPVPDVWLRLDQLEAFPA
ncbi:NAD(P)H-quinone oxidoreductase subunit O [Cyanobium sp. BA5m-21]|uniref:NAD(P)H-quinone oxidoreductase subunit O n=1 Tax=unclassified Cyanobium TaxID=2627006 RepID=UPI0020CDF236|nr:MULTISPECIES: NAD(P)H-quinone oxidoreductase subunit O [unclassified Cyanobium]MCP9903887.1 NAD(P)H-quinone oxidoreductase subunit O [Cyanobium sp. BA5m-10]MCP9907342.1 NAD(P)H-quinone oxidoreductase subunit O [Cyanobium sp. BA5m-21]MCP9914586.1 NAD(P)H-quinone oxidoreductase subunit O [Cyanobium sp. BA20m-14]